MLNYVKRFPKVPMKDSSFPSVSEQLSVEMVVKILMETSSDVAIAGNKQSHYLLRLTPFVRGRLEKLDPVLHHFVANASKPSTV